MFEKKQSTLIPSSAKAANPAVVSPKKNAFVQAGLKKGAETLSGNGALKFTTTGLPFVDEFGIAGSFRSPRDYKDVDASMRKLWAEDKMNCVKFAFYLRMVTRQVVFPDGTKTEDVQRGQGLKHEGIYRVMWLAINQPDVFWANIHVYISIGGWKDIITMLSYDLQFNHWKDRKLDWDKMGKTILAGLENSKTTNLVKKYLPQIKANSYCKTLEAQADNMIAKWICSLLYGGKPEANNASTYKKYRKLKVSGTAHEWQKAISQGNALNINFDSIHGRALALLVSGKFMKNNKLEDRYAKWIAAKPVAKYTGFVYELMLGVNNKLAGYQVDTINKQFMGQVEIARQGVEQNGSFVVVRDTSSSMGSQCTGTKGTCYDIAKALALYFSYLIPKGHFADSWIEFNSDAKFHTWSGATPVERWRNDHSSFVGSTNFQSVINLFCKIKRQGVPENEFPTGILCISDGEFNPTQLGITNVQQALVSLTNAGFSQKYVQDFQIVLWNLQSGYYGKNTGKKFETFGGVKNVFYFSGFDGSIIGFLTGMQGSTRKPPETAAELFEAAMDQQVLNMLEI